MLGMINKVKTPEKIQIEMLDLQASTNLNMSIAFFLM